MTDQEHAKHMIEIAQFALGKIRAMRIGKSNLKNIDEAWVLLSQVRDSLVPLTEQDFIEARRAEIRRCAASI